jgi:hypothetical protein
MTADSSNLAVLGAGLYHLDFEIASSNPAHRMAVCSRLSVLSDLSSKGVSPSNCLK